MATLEERYKNIVEKSADMQEDIRNKGAMLTVKKSSLKESQDKLKEKGIEFKSVKELRELKEGVEKGLEEKVTRMEEVMGLVEEDEDSMDSFDL